MTTVSSDTGTVTGDQAEEEPGFLDTVGEYVGDAYDTVSEYAGETVDTLERVAESVGEKLRRLLGSEEEQSNTSIDNPPIPEPRTEPRPDRRLIIRPFLNHVLSAVLSRLIIHQFLNHVLNRLM
jgi:hypothetical protein